jgi:hypothetical protein
MRRLRSARGVVALLALHLAAPQAAWSQQAPPALRAGVLGGALRIDGVLDEPGWSAAPSIDRFTQTDPQEGQPATERTVVRVLAGAGALIIGVQCDDGDPARIVSFSVRRDAALSSEDHIRVVIGPFQDGQSGYVFAVNPSGARYDGIINPGGESDSSDWDGIWEAATARSASGWTVEIRIPILTLAFKPGLSAWHFNIQRRIQRRLETDRWAFPARQYQVTQTSRAGLLTDLPQFSIGRGLTVRPAMTAGLGMPNPAVPVEGDFHPSLDVTQRLGGNILASLTVNTDFAETEVDTRRTNLTRFPLLFPEKRTFFLEGADVFSFGLGLGSDVIPFFSRRIGLVGGFEVPIIAGGKINGRIGQTNFSGLVASTNDSAGVATARGTMGVARLKRNVGKESWLGAIVTTGDPLARPGSWLTGLDATYATSSFRGDKNFLVGGWALLTDRQDLGRDRWAAGFKIDYPNDKWDMALTYKRLGEDFDPSLGFVPRRRVQMWSGAIDNATRIRRGPLMALFHEFEPSIVTDLSGNWESYRVFFAPLNWRFRSGDRVEFNANPTGERLIEEDEIAGVPVAAGSYHWRRYRLEAGTAQKRRLYTQLTYWFGGFYDGNLRQFIWTGAWNPTPLITVEFSGERNVGTLAAGRIDQTLTGTRVRLNLSPDLSVAAYVQYDTDSDSIGINSRLRWTLAPAGDVFVVYNHNVHSLLDRWRLESNQLLVKVQYAFRR